jgi:phosphoribosylformylglycinamidine synthase
MELSNSGVIDTPNLDDSTVFKNFFTTINQLNKQGLISAYHDRSDGGVITTLLEMAFAHTQDCL